MNNPIHSLTSCVSSKAYCLFESWYNIISAGDSVLCLALYICVVMGLADEGIMALPLICREPLCSAMMSSRSSNAAFCCKGSSLQVSHPVAAGANVEQEWNNTYSTMKQAQFTMKVSACRWDTVPCFHIADRTCHPRHAVYLIKCVFFKDKISSLIVEKTSKWSLSYIEF